MRAGGVGADRTQFSISKKALSKEVLRGHREISISESPLRREAISLATTVELLKGAFPKESKWPRTTRDFPQREDETQRVRRRNNDFTMFVKKWNQTDLKKDLVPL